MELYYKGLISKEATLEKLVDDLMLVVQGVGEYAEATGVRIPHATQAEIHSRLQRLRESCKWVKQHAIDTALATDKLLREYPYSSTGFAFALGLLAGALFRKQR